MQSSSVSDYKFIIMSPITSCLSKIWWQFYFLFIHLRFIRIFVLFECVKDETKTLWYDVNPFNICFTVDYFFFVGFQFSRISLIHSNHEFKCLTNYTLKQDSIQNEVKPRNRISTKINESQYFNRIVLLLCTISHRYYQIYRPQCETCSHVNQCWYV